MKIFIGEILTETNTFCPETTDLGFYKRGLLLEGDEIETALAGTETEINGFYSILRGYGDIEIIPGIAALSVTYGRTTAEAFHWLVTSLVQRIGDVSDLDGVLLALHGSMVSEDVDDCEGYILEMVRNTVGDNVAIVSTLDLHAAVSPKMVDNADVLVGYRTYPHTDHQKTGERAARCIVDIICKKTRIRKLFKQLPMISDPENTGTQKGLMRTVMERISQLESEEGMVSASFFTSHPWVDIYDSRYCMLAYVQEGFDAGGIETSVADILKIVWEARESLILRYPCLDDFIRMVDQYEKPVIVIDSGDVTTAGGTGDSTEVLRAFIDAGLNKRTTIIVVDPESVGQALALGEGKQGRFQVGGARDYGYNRKVAVDADITKINGEIVQVKGAAFAGIKLDMGNRALLTCRGGIKVMVCEYIAFFHDPEVLRSMGIDPENEEIIVQKTHKLYIPAYEGLYKSTVVLDTRGITDRHFDQMPFYKIERPIFPLDPVLL